MDADTDADTGMDAARARDPEPARAEIAGRDACVAAELIPAARAGHACAPLPLPHPSGISRWLNGQLGRARTGTALALPGASRLASRRPARPGRTWSPRALDARRVP